MPCQQLIFRALSIDDEDVVQFQVEARSATIAATIEFYGYADEFRSFGEDLRSFPQTVVSEVTYKNSVDLRDQMNHYLLIRIFSYDPTGRSAIHITTDNQEGEPFRSTSEFYILTQPAAINDLGTLLRHWNPSTVEEITWTAE